MCPLAENGTHRMKNAVWCYVFNLPYTHGRNKTAHGFYLYSCHPKPSTVSPLPYHHYHTAKYYIQWFLTADFAVSPFALRWHQQQKNAVDKLSVRFCPYTNGSIILPYNCYRTWCNRFAHAQYRIISLLDFGLTCEDSYLRQSNPAHCHCRLVWYCYASTKPNSAGNGLTRYESWNDWNP